MKKSMKKVFLAVMIIGLAVSLCGIAVAASEVSISGVINDSGQLVDDNGTAYDIAENEKGAQVMDMIGSKITVKGTVMEDEDMKTITITDFKVVEEEQ